MEPLYETSDSFGGSFPECDRPRILTVSIPEAKKRRQPTKHYVYKIVVNWSNGQSTVIYRRYSMFFDFMVKLQEMYASLKERNPNFSGDSQFPLPDLPGKVLFGRSQTHQVAEKRRVKVEEFCQTLVSLPSEISQSQLVIGFFNTWPDDTLHHSKSHLKDPTSPSNTNAINNISNGPTSPTGSSDHIISHPDEMENLEQYRVIADYERKDNHQVDLKAGEVVHVIEKHDTGWWMIITEEEQGYAPAAHLEAIDKTYDSLEPECTSNEEYEAMESYMAQSEDEIGLFLGDKVTVIRKSMDGWWKIRKKGRTGYCPATVIRRVMDVSERSRSPTTSAESISFESEKRIYEVLNIHKPPPRRNTINRQDIYVVPKNNPMNIKVAGASNSDLDTSAAYYKVPRKTHSSSSGSDDDRPHLNGIRELSPDHYELGPPESGDGHIYENTDFDHPMDPSEGVQHEVVYQNTSFDEQKPASQSGKLPLKKFGSPLLKRPLQQTKGASPNKDMDNEYINPEEFNITESASGNKTQNLKDSSPAIKGKYVSIMLPETPSSTPSMSSNVSQEKMDAVIKAKLTCSKSVGFFKPPNNQQQPDDEYVEMDPIYAPVAPDEPDYEESVNATAFVQSQEVPSTKKSRPPVPAPYDKKKSPDRPSSNIPKGSVLQRTKSLEDLLSKPSSNNHMPRGKGEAIQLGRNAPSDGYDHIKPLPNPKPTSVPTSSSPQVSKKPEPAKKSKKPYSIFKIASSGSSESKPEPVISAPVVVQSTNPSVDIPPPSLPPTSLPQRSSPKTYVAIEDYDSQAPGCLSFKMGEKCVLVKQAAGGWWLVNIGGEEGWTPGEFWEEDHRAMSAHSRPPTVAPPKLPPTKPRSHTTANTVSPSHSSSKLQHSISVDVASIDTEPTQSPIKPLPARPRDRPLPTKPKPTTSTNNSPPNSRKLEHNSSASDMKLGSPPPPPPPRKTNSQSVLRTVPNDYSLLEEATITPLEECPWFVGGMEREKAEQFLIDKGRQREFLIRERKTKKGYYALSIRHHYSVKHFNIDPKQDGSYSMGVMQFSSIEEIVKYYQQNSLFVHEGQPVTLGQPVKPKNSSKFSQQQ